MKGAVGFDTPASGDSLVVQVALLALAAPVLPYHHILHLDGAHVAQHLHLLIPDVLCIQTHLPTGMAVSTTGAQFWGGIKLAYCICSQWTVSIRLLWLLNAQLPGLQLSFEQSHLCAASRTDRYTACLQKTRLPACVPDSTGGCCSMRHICGCIWCSMANLLF